MNINEIARLAGVSRATVSRYLNNGYVSEEKKKVIRQVIEETGYQPSSQAQMLRTKKTKLVGVILPKINSNTISREVAGISDILTKKGYQIILANTNNDIEDPCIYQDDYKAAAKLTEQMAESGKHFGYITVTDQDEAVGQRRRAGVEETLQKLEKELKPECVKCGDFTVESGHWMTAELFQENPNLDTVICATDTMAVGAMTWLKENGYRIPEDVQVAGLGDGYLGKIVEPKLTTVHFFYKTSGMEAASMLVDLMESEETKICKEIKMGCELVLRESHRQ